MNAAAVAKAQAGQVAVALEATRVLPPVPPDCRETARSGVRVGDRLDIALLKTDWALAAANSRIIRCAEWHDMLRGTP